MRLTRLPSGVKLTRLPDPVVKLADPDPGLTPVTYSDFDRAGLSAYFDRAVPDSAKGLLDAVPWTGTVD